MRLWSLHPSMLDQKGLVALWRETLLAKAVLEGKTKGYKNHSQLVRLKACKDPVAAISQYLFEVWVEATMRGYKFDQSKIGLLGIPQTIPVNLQQLVYEFNHLQTKLVSRDKSKFESNSKLTNVSAMSMFNVIEGPIESWEIVK